MELLRSLLLLNEIRWWLRFTISVCWLISICTPSSCLIVTEPMGIHGSSASSESDFKAMEETTIVVATCEPKEVEACTQHITSHE